MAYPSVAPSLSGDLGLHLEGLCGGQPSHSSVGQAVARKQSLGGSAAAQETTGSQTVSLTVRTLDKKEHRLSVVHDISVAALKEEVAVITSIDADSQRLVSWGEEMSPDRRLSDYCSAKCHTIYLVVRFPGISYGVPQGHDAEDVEIEPAASSAAVQAPLRTNPRIVLRGTVTIPVPERDVHRVVHSLMGSQTNLGDFVNSMACNPSGQSRSRVRRGSGGTARPRGQRGRQARRAARTSPQRGTDHRNSVNVSFRGSEWETMRVWPQSIDFRAGFGDELLYDALEESGAEGFRLRYSSGAHRGTSATLSDDDSAGLSSLLECDDHGDQDIDDSYLSADRTMLAQDSQSSDAYMDSGFEGVAYAGSSMQALDAEDWELDCYDGHGMCRNELPLGRIAGKRKYAEMCNSPAMPLRSAPRSRSMAPSGVAALRPPLPGEPPIPARVVGIAVESGANNCGEGDEDVDQGGDRDASWAVYSPNISISLGSQPGGASPDSAEAISPLLAEDPMPVGTIGVQREDFCRSEVRPSAQHCEEMSCDASVAGPSAGSRQRSRHGCEAEGSLAAASSARDHSELGQSTHCSMHEAAKASGDPLAAADVHAVDSHMASLSLRPQDLPVVGETSIACLGETAMTSTTQVVDAAKSGCAVYKTHPEPLRLESGARGSETRNECSDSGAMVHRNKGGALDKLAVPKNQCCVVM